jgi:hypothetical protein
VNSEPGRQILDQGSVRLTAVGHGSVSSIVGKGPTWEYAAEDVLKALEKWPKENHDTVAGRRAQMSASSR